MTWSSITMSGMVMLIAQEYRPPWEVVIRLKVRVLVREVALVLDMPEMV